MHIDQIMESWTNQHSLHAAKRCEQLLLALELNYQSLSRSDSHSSFESEADSESKKRKTSPSSLLIPNSISYNHVIQSYAQSGGGEQAARKAEEILHRMLHNQSETPSTKSPKSPPPQPIPSTYHQVMSAWSKSNSIDAGLKAEEIYALFEEQQQQQPHNHKDTILRPSARSLAIVFDAWANSSNHPDAVHRVITTLHHVIEKERQALSTLSSSSSSSSSSPSTTSTTKPRPLRLLNKVVFHSVLLTLANHVESQSFINNNNHRNRRNNNNNNAMEYATKAQEIFDLMQSLHENDFYMDDENNNGCHAENDNIILVNDNSNLSLDDNNLRPNTRTWSLLLRCWTNAVNPNDPDGGERAASHADSLLRAMEELYKDGYDVKPNSYCYASCIQAWSKCKSKTGFKQAMEILQSKERMYQESKDDELCPNSFEYNVCLSALCGNVGDNGTIILKDAERLFETMKEYGVADTTSHNTMMSAYIKANVNQCHIQVWDLFQQMKESGCTPDVISYNTVIDAMGRSGDSKSIKHIIHMLESMIESKDEIMPNKRTFTTVLNAIAKSNLEEKAEPARKVLRQLISLYDSTNNNESIKPDVAVFGAFLSCCASQSGSNDRKRYALKLSLGTYEELCNQQALYGKPNEYIYGSLMKACNRLSQDTSEKIRLLEYLFNRCKEEGRVSNAILNIILKNSPVDTRNKIIQGCEKVNGVDDAGVHHESSLIVPMNWCCNVLQRNQPSRQSSCEI